MAQFTYFLYQLFEEYSPFKLKYNIQNNWIKEVFIYASYLSYGMDLYCCKLIDIMIKCCNIKSLTKYKFTSIIQKEQTNNDNNYQQHEQKEKQIKHFI